MWNPFKTKERLVGVKLFISEDLPENLKMKIALDFCIHLNQSILVSGRETKIFHHIENIDFTKDPEVTVIYLKFRKSRNWYSDHHFTKRYYDIISDAWKEAEMNNFTWDKFDATVYPVVES